MVRFLLHQREAINDGGGSHARSAQLGAVGLADVSSASLRYFRQETAGRALSASTPGAAKPARKVGGRTVSESGAVPRFFREGQRVGDVDRHSSCEALACSRSGVEAGLADRVDAAVAAAPLREDMSGTGMAMRRADALSIIATDGGKGWILTSRTLGNKYAGFEKVDAARLRRCIGFRAGRHGESQGEARGDEGERKAARHRGLHTRCGLQIVGG